jgi:hypothetical protein
MSDDLELNGRRGARCTAFNLRRLERVNRA